MKDNIGLVQWCQNAVDFGWRYWYGTVGYKCTLDLYNRKKKQYPAHYTADRYDKYMQDIAEGRTCCDCVNLIKAYGWDDEGTQRYGTNGCPDTNANGMFARAKEKGSIDTIPEIPGLAVRKDGHVGVYIGDGWVIEAKGFKYGVVRTKLSATKWTHWYKLHWLTYTDGEVEATEHVLGDRVLGYGYTGEDVRQLQTYLLSLGYDLGSYGADSEYGNITARAVKNLQEATGVLANGIYTAETHAALMSLLGDVTSDTDDEPEAESSGTLTVTGNTVNVRQGPGTQFGIITVVKKNDKLAQVDSTGWSLVLVNGQAGWISAKYTKGE